MKFDHKVKFKGLLYEIGEDVPVEDKVEEKKITKPVVEEYISEKNFLDEFAESIKPTKTEINRMPIVELKKMARENGLDDNCSGAEIKKALIDKFGL